MFFVAVLVMTHDLHEKSLSNKQSPKCMNIICVLDAIIIKALLLLF